MARLDQLLRDPAHLPVGGAVYARLPWEATSDAVVVADTDHPLGYEYVLETDLIREVLTVWSQWRDGRAPAVAESVEAVLHYARFDSYLPV